MCSKWVALGLVLSLGACAGRPVYRVPVARAGYPIITSGVFALEDGASLPYRLYPAVGRQVAVVLALHGYTDSRDGWALAARQLNAAGITVYAPDQAGFGANADRGRWPGTARLLREARAMAAQLRARNASVPLYIMGESMGGAEAILLAASAHPPDVAGYVISAPAVWGGAAMNPAYRLALGLGDAVLPQKRLTGQAAHVKASDNKAALIAFGRDPLTLHAPSIDSLAGLVRLMGAAQAACGRIHERALILYGGHDELIPPAAMRACWDAIPKNAPVELAYYPPDYHLIERDLERAVPLVDIVGYITGQGVRSDAPSAATVFLAGG